MNFLTTEASVGVLLFKIMFAFTMGWIYEFLKFLGVHVFFLSVAAICPRKKVW
jgi:hypothetical protein